MLSNHLILCRPLLLLPSVFPSISVFSNESAFHIRWPKYWGFSLRSKYWRFSFSISPSNEYSGWLFFRIDQFGFLAVQGTQESSPTPQFKSLNSLALSPLLVQLSHTYITTVKTIALTIQTFVSKVMSLLFDTLFRFVANFYPRSKCLLISWLLSPSAVILEPKKRKYAIVSINCIIYHLSLQPCLALLEAAAQVLLSLIPERICGLRLLRLSPGVLIASIQKAFCIFQIVSTYFVSKPSNEVLCPLYG